MPQRKKHASTRARRNRAATAALLVDGEPVDRSGWNAKQLRDEIDRRNAVLHEDERLSKAGGKAGMIDTLLEDDLQIPELPDRPGGWTIHTRQWWRDVWSSPMSKEWHPESDWHNVVAGAMHYDDMWMAEKPAERQKAQVQFKVVCDFLGLNPYARRRLEWTIETAREAQERGAQRRGDGAAARGQAPPPAAEPAADPRGRFSVVK